jgi:hypothetical protein
MTHTEIVDQILLQGLKQGDLVEVELNNGEKAKGRLSSDKVLGDEIKGEVENSRIGLTPPPPPPGMIYPSIINTVYSVNIKRITKI